MMAKIVKETLYALYGVHIVHIPILGGECYYSHFMNLELRLREAK